jgi:hypothetical protein
MEKAVQSGAVSRAPKTKPKRKAVYKGKVRGFGCPLKTSDGSLSPLPRLKQKPTAFQGSNGFSHNSGSKKKTKTSMKWQRNISILHRFKSMFI